MEPIRQIRQIRLVRTIRLIRLKAFTYLLIYFHIASIDLSMMHFLFSFTKLEGFQKTSIKKDKNHKKYKIQKKDSFYSKSKSDLKYRALTGQLIFTLYLIAFQNTTKQRKVMQSTARYHKVPQSTANCYKLQHTASKVPQSA